MPKCLFGSDLGRANPLGAAWVGMALAPTPSSLTPPTPHLEEAMLHWAATFFVIAIIAAIFGFGGIASSAAGIAKILFFVFLVLFVISLLLGRKPAAS